MKDFTLFAITSSATLLLFSTYEILFRQKTAAKTGHEESCETNSACLVKAVEYL